MSSSGYRYWRVFNVLVRVLGLTTLAFGVVFIAWGTLRLLHVDFISAESEVSLAILPIGLLVAAIGWAIVRTPAYRPDLGDVSWGFDPLGTKITRAAGAKRSWWTGEPVTGRS
jgi:uncharacterized membrane protein